MAVWQHIGGYCPWSVGPWEPLGTFRTTLCSKYSKHNSHVHLANMGPTRFDRWVKAELEFDKDLIIIEQERVPNYREYISDSWLRDYFADFVPEKVA